MTTKGALESFELTSKSITTSLHVFSSILNAIYDKTSPESHSRQKRPIRNAKDNRIPKLISHRFFGKQIGITAWIAFFQKRFANV